MNELDIVQLPSGFDAVVIDGIPRALNKLAPDPVKRAAFPPYGAMAAPIVDPSQWVELNRRQTFGTEWLINQQSHGSCVGFATAGSMMRAVVLGGQAFVRLSGAYIYSWINGGYDNGAQISDGLTAGKVHGTCLESTVGWNDIYRSQAKKGDTEAQRWKILEAYRADNFQELMSGVQLGFLGVGAVQVGNSFSHLNGEGVCGFDSGPGNHAVCFDGADQLPSGEWVLDMPNSWGPSFGQTGRGKITERHIDSVYQDCFIIRAGTVDPQDPNNPPPVK